MSGSKRGGRTSTKNNIFAFDDMLAREIMVPRTDMSCLLQEYLLEQKPVKDLLKRMQKQGTHIAILIDEYGGTTGMVTIEDIL